jgi:hypothetical protein
LPLRAMKVVTSEGLLIDAAAQRDSARTSTPSADAAHHADPNVADPPESPLRRQALFVVEGPNEASDGGSLSANDAAPAPSAAAELPVGGEKESPPGAGAAAMDEFIDGVRDKLSETKKGLEEGVQKVAKAGTAIVHSIQELVKGA